MGTSVERDLKTLRASKLMSTCPEYSTMMIELEKFHKEQTRLKERNEHRELDLRPYLYDNGDTYEKPFYDVLLKLLYDVASFQSPEKQHEDVSKVYEWFLSHQRLISEDTVENGSSNDVDDINKNTEIPKLHFRPKSADGNCYRGSQTNPDMKYRRETHSKSALGCYENERIRKRKDYNPLNRISVSLKVLPLNGAAAKNHSGFTEYINYDSYSKSKPRNIASSIPVHKPRKSSLPSTFVLKPCNQTSPPVSSPVFSPSVSSPSVSPKPSRRTLSPSYSARSSPVAKFYSNLNTPHSGVVTKSPSGKPVLDDLSGLEVEHVSLKGDTRRNSTKKFEEFTTDNMETSEISNTNLAAYTEAGLFQDQLRQCSQSARKKKEMEIVENLKKDVENIAKEEESLQSQLLREHKQFLRDDNEMHAKMNEVKESSKFKTSSRATTLPTVDLYDFSSHRPVSAVEFRDKGVRIESVLDIVHPVGEQMKYQREIQAGTGVSIWDMQSATCGHESYQSLQRLHSAPPRSTFPGGGDRQAILKLTEPDLNPEMRASDYTVHFPRQSNRESTVKDFKVSGPVSPDSIRYQWTDDGFGNRTYLKKRSPVESQSRKSPKSPPPVSSNDVAMVTGERGLDKKTIASLVVIKHLGTNRRRESFERDYPRFIIEDSTEPLASYDDITEDVKPKHNVEYLPFWKQLPPKKGLTILNIPEQGEPDINTDAKKKTTDENQNTVKDPSGSSIAAQNILNEMFSCLTPQRRTLKGGFDASSLSVRARSISPEPRRPQAQPESRDLRLGPSPTPVHSRPTSARRSNKENIPPSNFSVKHFSHFCFDDDLELMDDYRRQREIWAAINIQRIFRGHMARQYATSLKHAEKERQRKAAVALQSTFRGYLARKKLMKQNVMNYKPGVRDLQWAREYKEKLKAKEVSRHRRNQGILRQHNRQFEKQQEQISGVTASNRIHEIFNPPKPTKAQMKAAAITIQRYYRGWFVRKSLTTVKEKALKRTFSFNKFIKSYQDLVHRIQKRYNIENPNTALQFHELQEYVDRLFKYEIAFSKIAENGTLRYEDILKYFAECGHHPSDKEVDDAIAMVTNGSPKGRNLTKSEAVEVAFQIYIPKGTGLTLADVRKSTWMNPLIDGQDVKKLLSKKDLKFTSLDKVLNLVADSQSDRNEVKELLRAPDPQIMNVVDKSQEKHSPQSKDGKKPRQSSAKSPGGGNFILARAQYQPVKPNESKQNKKRRPVSGRSQK